MRTATEDRDFSGQTIENLQGYYLKCNFNNVTLTGRINAVLKNCTAENIVVNGEIDRLHTPGTRIKPTVQPIHAILTRILSKFDHWKQHNHSYHASKLRDSLNWIEDKALAAKVSDAADLVETRLDLSWDDFREIVGKDVWDLYEFYYFDDPISKMFVERKVEEKWNPTKLENSAEVK